MIKGFLILDNHPHLLFNFVRLEFVTALVKITDSLSILITFDVLN
jgi:hypothetical protein